MIGDKVKVFKALGDPTRLAIVGYLLKNDHCACDFHDMSGKDQTTVSRHLKTLHDAGLVKFRKDGRNIIYSIKDDQVRSYLDRMGIEPQDECCGQGSSKDAKAKAAVKKSYGRIALEGGGCGCGTACCGDGKFNPIQMSMSIGYSEDELRDMADSNLGLGCGNPGALGSIKEGETVLDLGSGAGLDAFLALKKVGTSGKVIGVDITREMVERSTRIARERGYPNVEFRLGDIEDLPVDDGSVDVVLSNCVINLVPDKRKAFSEAYRVLRSGGRLLISDMVLLKRLTAAQRKDEKLMTGCVGGASLRKDYLKFMEEAGFRFESIVDDEEIGRMHYEGLPVESIKIVAIK
ncbi:MAG: arsenite methyltransferase [Methanomassiliicoccales archaeon]